MKNSSHLIILGMASSSRKPFGEAPRPDDAEIWKLSWDFNPPDADVLFDLHTLAESLTCIQGYPSIMQKFNEAGTPVYIQELRKEFPHGVRYPLEEVSKFFGWRQGKLEDQYFTSSIAFMLALALWQHATGQVKRERIDLVGVDMMTGSEYEYQRPCVEFYVGYGRGMGIQINVPVQSAILKGVYLYGYQEPPTTGALSIELLDKRVATYDTEYQRALIAQASYDGARKEAGAIREMVADFLRKGGVTNASGVKQAGTVGGVVPGAAGQ